MDEAFNTVSTAEHRRKADFMGSIECRASFFSLQLRFGLSWKTFVYMKSYKKEMKTKNAFTGSIQWSLNKNVKKMSSV